MNVGNSFLGDVILQWYDSIKAAVEPTNFILYLLLFTKNTVLN